MTTARASLAVAAILLTGYAAVAWRVSGGFSNLTLSPPEAEAIYDDTYYVVAHLHLIIAVCLAVLLPMLLHALILRHADRRWVRRTSLGCLFASLAGLLLWSFGDLQTGIDAPRQFVDSTNLALRWLFISLAAMGLVLTAFATSLILTVLDLIHRRTRPHT